MLARLENPLGLLAALSVDMPDRHHTLRQTIEWSHSLLNPAEKRLFRRLAVFAGGCTLEGAEAVCNTWADLGMDLLEGISSLVDKSLLERNVSNGEPRFAMLQTIRDFALEQLSASLEIERVRRAHAAYCLVLAEEGIAQRTVLERAAWLRCCDVEHGNLRDALDWLTGTGHVEWAMRMGTALFEFWRSSEFVLEGQQRLQAVLRLTGLEETALRARALGYCGILASYQGDYSTAYELHRAAIAVHSAVCDAAGVMTEANNLSGLGIDKGDYPAAEEWGKQSWKRRVNSATPWGSRRLNNRALIALARGENAQSKSLYEEALAIFRNSGDANGVAFAFDHLGDVACNEGNLGKAGSLYREAAEAFRQPGNRSAMARSLTDLGYVCCLQQDHETAHALFDEALRIFLKLGQRKGVARAIDGFATLAVGRLQYDRALGLAGAAAALRHRIAAPAHAAERAQLERGLKPAWENLAPEEGEARWKTGWKLPLDQAVRYTLDREGPIPHS